MSIHVDFETRSAANLKNTGAYLYARHRSTSVLCLAYSLDSGQSVEVWRIGEPAPEKLLREVRAGQPLYAFNAQFERHIWSEICVKQMGWPEVAEWRCSMVLAAAAGLPLSLEKCAEFLELEDEKDRAGKAMMTKMAKAENAKHDNEEKWQKLLDYCMQDVVVEAAIHRRIAEMPSVKKVMRMEEELIRVDRQINDRGVPIDVETCRAIVRVLDVEKENLNQELRDITGGEVQSGQSVAQLKKWVCDNGLPIANTTADVIDAAIRVCDDDRVRRVLEIRQATSQGSTAKIAKMLQGVGPDCRARDLFQVMGASQTGRWAGRRIQLQNLPRLKTTDQAIEVAVQAFTLLDVVMLEMLFGDSVSAAKQMLRPMVCSDRGLVVADYAQIELRVAAWLAGERRLMDIFHSDADAYIGMAGKIFGKSPIDVSKSERFVGKVAMLGCQYQMGSGRFAETLQQFGVEGTDEELEELAEISVPAFREMHPSIKRLWYQLTDAAIQAFRDHKLMQVGRIKFRRLPGTDTLVMILPSGRPLHYWFVKLEEGKYGPALTHKTVRQNKIVRAGLYGGRWLENAAQAISRDLLAHALVRLHNEGQEIIGHVHDEILVEGGDKPAVERAMTEDLPAWANGLPVKVEAFNCDRYTK